MTVSFESTFKWIKQTLKRKMKGPILQVHIPRNTTSALPTVSTHAMRSQGSGSYRKYYDGSRNKPWVQSW